MRFEADIGYITDDREQADQPVRPEIGSHANLHSRPQPMTASDPQRVRAGDGGERIPDAWYQTNQRIKSKANARDAEASVEEIGEPARSCEIVVQGARDGSSPAGGGVDRWRSW